MLKKPITTIKTTSTTTTASATGYDDLVAPQLLHDTFSAFGVIIATPKIMRDPETGNSRGFGFISYDSFEAADAALEAMAGQYLCNRPIAVSYAFKKDTKGVYWVLVGS